MGELIQFRTINGDYEWDTEKHVYLQVAGPYQLRYGIFAIPRGDAFKRIYEQAYHEDGYDVLETVTKERGSKTGARYLSKDGEPLKSWMFEPKPSEKTLCSELKRMIIHGPQERVGEIAGKIFPFDMSKTLSTPNGDEIGAENFPKIGQNPTLTEELLKTMQWSGWLFIHRRQNQKEGKWPKNTALTGKENDPGQHAHRARINISKDPSTKSLKTKGSSLKGRLHRLESTGKLMTN